MDRWTSAQCARLGGRTIDGSVFNIFSSIIVPVSEGADEDEDEDEDKTRKSESEQTSERARGVAMV